MRHACLRLIGAAALIVSSAQMAQAQTANGSPQTDIPPKPATKIDPKLVTAIFNALTAPKPKPTPTTIPAQPPAPVPAPSATIAPTPAAPSPKPGPRPIANPATSVVPQPAPLPRPAHTAAPAPQPAASTVAEPATTPELASPPPDLDLPIPQDNPPARIPWAVIAGLIALTAAAGYGLRSWFWPKLALTCRIDAGLPRIAKMAHPLVSGPELQIQAEIEVGTASAPRGLTIS